MMIYVCCPPRIATGGVELLHQLVFELNSQSPGLAKILYIDDMPEAGFPMPPQYEKYKNPISVNQCEADGAVFILPEIWAHLAQTRLAGCSSVIWWESVDNYFYANPPGSWYGFAQNKSMLHMVQSAYARGFLLENAKIPKERILEVSDYLGEDFLDGRTELVSHKRKPVVLYNPQKGLDFTRKLMEASPELVWVPLKGMSSSELAALMRESRVYVDFGNHPGKDRMPREPAVCGCCIITGRNGSASYPEDVPIPGSYKFERRESNIPAICQRIEELVRRYDRHIGDFAHYRCVIRGEKARFREDVGRLISVLSG